MCCFSVVALKSRLKYYGGQTEFLSQESIGKNSTKAFFKAKDKEIVYISQSDLGALQLIFKDNNSTSNGETLLLKISLYNLLCNFYFEKSCYATAQPLLFSSVILVDLI